MLGCCALFLAGPAVRRSKAADDGDAKGKAAGADFFGLTKVVKLHIEIPAEEYQAMQPPAPPGGPARAVHRRPVGRGSLGSAKASGTSSGSSSRGRAGTSRWKGRRTRAWPPLLGERLVHGVGGGPEAFPPDRAGPLRAAPISTDFARFSFRAVRSTPRRRARRSPSPYFREAGVPAPRTALAEVTLTVPGEHEKAYLGLYTLVEPVDRAFLTDRFHTDKGLLVRPQGLRGLDFLGDDWEKYRGPYRPLAEPTPDEAKRLIEFLRLVQQGDDEQFRKEIGSYLDVDKFLRFMAVQALIANADGFFTLAYNYSLFLDPNTNRFVFIPGDQELSFANFLMMGSADQLMDMSLARPYGGENRLADRLLAIKDVKDSYQKIVKDLASSGFPQGSPAGRRAGDRGCDESDPRARSGGARQNGRSRPWDSARREGRRRLTSARLPRSGRVSIADQLAGKKDGYRPQFNFGPPGRGAPAKPVDDKTIGDVVKAPSGFRVTLFAAPPKVGYPVTLSVAPDGAVYVAVDEQGSLGRTPGGGRVRPLLR